jgi:glycosyltransferase involved in cell wall biosynthesis
MRIAVVNNFFPPRIGGSSHLSDSLAREYAAAGHEVLVLTAAYRGAPSAEERDGLQIVRLPAWTLPRLGLSIDFDVSFTTGPRNLRRVFRILDGFRPDVIHQHGQFLDLAWSTGLYARRRGVQVLLSVHTRLESPDRLFSTLFRCLDAVLVRPLLAMYRPVFVVMDRLMEDYIIGRYGAPPHRMVPIPVRVHTDPERMTGDGAAVRAEFGIGDRPMILSVGHVIPLRNRLLLVEALPAIVGRHPEAVVVVLGDVLYPAFLERARQLGVDGHVICTGPVPRDRVADFLAAADVDIHDLQGYGLGTASLEAMLARVPVVAAVAEDNFPGIELRSGENITLVGLGRADQLAEAVSDLLDDPERAAPIAEAQGELVQKHFSMDAVVRSHLEVLGPWPTRRCSARGGWYSRAAARCSG